MNVKEAIEILRLFPDSSEVKVLIDSEKVGIADISGLTRPLISLKKDS